MSFSHKKKEILKFVTTWMNPEDYTLSEISQTQGTDAAWFHLYAECNGHTRRSRQENGGGGATRGGAAGRDYSQGTKWQFTNHSPGDSPRGMSPRPLTLRCLHSNALRGWIFLTRTLNNNSVKGVGGADRTALPGRGPQTGVLTSFPPDPEVRCSPQTPRLAQQG